MEKWVLSLVPKATLFTLKTKYMYKVGENLWAVGINKAWLIRKKQAQNGGPYHWNAFYRLISKNNHKSSTDF